MLAQLLGQIRPERESNVVHLRVVSDSSYDPAAAAKADKAFDAWIIALAKRMASQDHSASLNWERP